MITTEIKKVILEQLAKKRENFHGSDAKFAVSINISSAQYSLLKNGNIDRVISESAWISLARMLEISLGKPFEWKIAKTPVFDEIWEDLTYCQEYSASRLLCDVPDIGKSFTAKLYAKNHKNAVYIDCSQVKSKQKLIRGIAKSFGVGHTGKYSEVYADLAFCLQSLPTPFVMLDEVGDLEYPAFLELKAIWNAAEGACGWYMMGADALREKFRRSIENKKVGWAEIFSRYGNKYLKITEDSAEEFKNQRRVLAFMVIKANAPEVDAQKLAAKCDYSLRRIYDEIRKLKGNG